jgi:spectinomycin phosphotransferase
MASGASPGTDARTPALARDLAAALRSGYGIEAEAIEPSERGKDFAASVFVVFSGGHSPSHIVKVRPAGAGRDTAAAVARHLADAGVPGVVAPIRTLAGAASDESERFSLTVYPYIDGQIGIEMQLSDASWRALGRFARRLHETVLPEDLASILRRESYEPPDFQRVPIVDAAVVAWTAGDAVSRRVVELWREQRDEILALAARATALGDALRTRALPLVTCHADLHTGNLIVDADERVWVIDWDEVVLAPRERDLMFAVGGGIATSLVSERATARFLEGYGDVQLDDQALSYYRHAWAVQDVGGYAWRVLLDDSATLPQREDAAEILVGLFRPGEIVDLARRAATTAET